MSELTTDPNDPRLGHGADETPRPQSAVYLVLSDQERAKGFVRPVRCSYVHVGLAVKYPVRGLTEEERLQHEGCLGYMEYPAGSEERELGLVGRYWTKAQLEGGCGSVTSMSIALAETYARDPKFYGSTYCVHCGMHRPVEEFVWEGTDERVGS